MQFCVYEFEFVHDDDGWYEVYPFDMGGGTQGEDFADACDMAADWLKCVIEEHEISEKPMPKATFGNTPRYENSKIVVIGVSAGRETIPKLSAADAARRLGVTPARVSQMVKGHVITGWREGTRTWVDLESLENYTKRRRSAGRPKKTCAPDVPADEDIADDAPQAAVG